jgi:putative ABC transport system permease protein
MALDVVFETVGSELPHDLWLSLAPDADTAAVQHEAVALGFPILEWRSPAEQFRAALAAPLRRGVLGFLSVGFVASIGLTLVAAIIQSTAAFRAQAAQLGSLRAMGLGALSVALYLLLVQGLSAMGGIAGGTLIGVATTLLYLPVLDFSTGLPPYLVRVAWNDIALVYAAFAGVLLVVTAITTFVMGRESLSALVKLGD